MSLLKEFKEFAVRGNVVDMAVGVVIGGAFGKIVTSVVNDLIMPPLGMLIGGVSFRDLRFVLKEGAADKGPVVIGYGAFIQTIVDFTIIAGAVFLLVKVINRVRRLAEQAPPPPAAPPAEPSAEVKLLTEIRDALARR